MNATRDKILQTLLKKPKSTINDLAEAVGINPISVRHHLNNLQMEGLVESQEERHGVGRPRLVYLLTNEGRERFPTRYLQLTTRLIAQMKESMPGSVVSKLFGKIAEDLVSEYANDIKGLSMEERLDFVKEMLGQEGFTVEWEKKGKQYEIHEISCPYYQIGMAHPEVCTVDQTLISKMLAVPANKVQCILNGGTHCTYVVDAAPKTR
ncbi:MAG: winged helix-turn-helix transcriptional regulator [Anaerolineales bacterium]|jgi:DeoR family suf operon transcriptional repressor|nr:winged helix-turn-helix transcriptional regulator [Chloroflexota bacterium]MBK6647007.1 winged helix-turn-helix transcriptional regulator [Anaerolineales bacterium]MCC6985249.1 winged helix-turn-helix transcriptional regulator [Anaerolineales bacterium]